MRNISSIQSNRQGIAIDPGQEQLNYLRSARVPLEEWIKMARIHHPTDADVCERLLSGSEQAQKFILPSGGKIIGDGLKGLHGDTPLHLPFKKIVIEFEVPPHQNNGLHEKLGYDKLVSSRRRIVFAQETGDCIDVYLVCDYTEHDSIRWVMAPFFARIKKTSDIYTENVIQNAVLIYGLEMKFYPTGTILDKNDNKWMQRAYADLHDEIRAVLELIEALACSNVGHEALPARKLNKSAQKRGALPFDEYRVLTVKVNAARSNRDDQGSGRSLREHLRRGHIRRLHDGRRIWINSCVVAAGASGRIFTTQQIRAA